MKEWMFSTHARKAEELVQTEGLEMTDRNGGQRVDRHYWYGFDRPYVPQDNLFLLFFSRGTNGG